MTQWQCLLCICIIRLYKDKPSWPLVWDSGNFLWREYFTRIVYREIQYLCFYHGFTHRKTNLSKTLHLYEKYFLINSIYANDKNRNKKKRKKNGYSLLIICALGNVNRIDIRKKKRSIFLHHLIMNTCRHTSVFTGKWYIIYCT